MELRTGFRTEGSWSFLGLSNPYDTTISLTQTRGQGQARFFPIKANNRRVHSLSLLLGCLDLGGYEIVR